MKNQDKCELVGGFGNEGEGEEFDGVEKGGGVFSQGALDGFGSGMSVG